MKAKSLSDLIQKHIDEGADGPEVDVAADCLVQDALIDWDEELRLLADVPQHGDAPTDQGR